MAIAFAVFNGKSLSVTDTSILQRPRCWHDRYCIDDVGPACVDYRSVVMTSLSTWALMKIEGPIPAVMTLKPAKYSSAARDFAGAVSSRDGKLGIEKMDTAVLKFSAHGNLREVRRSKAT